MNVGTVLVTSALLGVFTGTALAQEPPAGAQRVPGNLSQDPTVRTVLAPENVRVGTAFPVTITTTGGGCETPGDNSVILGNRVANIHVYDFTTAVKPVVACTMIFKQFTHTVTLTFTEAGRATIRVWGRHTGPEGGTPVTLDVPINVTP